MIPPALTLAPALPAGAPVQGGERRKVETEILVRNNAAGAYGGGAAVIARFAVAVGSARLACCVGVGFVPDGAEDAEYPPSGAGAWLLRLDAWMRTSRANGGRPVRVNTMIDAVPIPTSYEVETTGVDEWRGQVTIPNAPGSSFPAGDLYVIAAWEPAPGVEVSDAELGKLFAIGGIRQIVGQTTSVTGAG